MERIGLVVAAALALAGCAKDSRATLVPHAGQASLVRDGREALTSQKGGSEVVVATTGIEPLALEVTIRVTACNRTGAPITLRQGAIRVTTADGAPVKVWTREQLVERSRAEAVFGAVVGGAAAAGSVYAANPRYSTPLANQIVAAGATGAGNRAAAGAMAQGEATAAGYAARTLADNTVMPGECLGGQVVFSADRRGNVYEGKSYVITVPFGGASHEFRLNTAPVPLGG